MLARRAYTSHPVDYPASGTKPIEMNDWFEIVVITDHLDMRGWGFTISNRTGEPAIPGPGEKTYSLTLSLDPVWSDLRSGTIITIAEDIPSTASDYSPETGEWWINAKASDTSSGRYITAANFAVSNDKTQIIVVDALGQEVYGPSGEGISPLSGVGNAEVFKLEDTPFAGTFPETTWYRAGGSSSFGLPNDWIDPQGPMQQNFSLLRSSVPYFPLSTVVINEINSHSDPPQQDWIELHNKAGSAVNIGGWFLSDTSTNLMAYTIPPGTTIPGTGYLVFLEADLPFSLNGETGETVYLSQGNGFGGMTGGRDFMEFGPMENGVTFGRYPNATGETFRLSEATIGSANSEPAFGPLVINEVMYNGVGSGPAALTGSDLEYIEIFNRSQQAVALSEDYGPDGVFPWKLTGGLSFEFPASASVAAESYLLVVSFDPVAEPIKLSQFASYYSVPASIPILGPYIGGLNNYSDTVNLRRPDRPRLGMAPMVLRDSLTYFDWNEWPISADGGGASLERIDPFMAPSGASHWAASLVLGGTPGLENTVLNTLPEPSATLMLQVGAFALVLLWKAARGQSRSPISR